MLGIDIDYSRRNVGIDLMKAFAIFCVVHRHGQHLLSWWPEWLRLPHGVDVFFVISGFLIGGMFIRKYSSLPRADWPETCLRFWIRTLFRIVPCYLVILMVNYLLVSWALIPGEVAFPIWRYATFTQNIAQPFYGYFWESWSLPVQMWFYLLFPLLLAFMSKPFGVKTSVLAVSFLGIAVSVVFRWLQQDGLDAFWWDVTMRKTVLSRMDSIFYGVLAAWCVHYHPSIMERWALVAFIMGMICYGVCSLLPYDRYTFVGGIMYLSVPALGYALMLPLLTRLGAPHTHAGHICVDLSILSFSVYLLNLLWMQLLTKHCDSFLSGYPGCSYLLFWLLTWGSAWCLYHLVERPMMRIRDKVLIVGGKKS